MVSTAGGTRVDQVAPGTIQTSDGSGRQPEVMTGARIDDPRPDGHASDDWADRASF
jgi:hypothetical protein